jgi:hypothetical protein
MPRVIIDGHIVLSYDYLLGKKKFWSKLSQFIISTYGDNAVKKHKIVESILLDSFQFFVQEFKKIVLNEQHFTFFQYAYWLHEESINIYEKTLGGYKLVQIDESEFAVYRRILKLILEQGCDIELNFGKKPTTKELAEFELKLQDLIYLGNWIYKFADCIAFQKMVNECHSIEFSEKKELIINWQHHYATSYKTLFPLLRIEYEMGLFDETAIIELKSAINSCFNIDFDLAVGLIFNLKNQLNPIDPSLQTFEPYVLPINLSHQLNISKQTASQFYDGLSLSKENKLTIEQAVLKPYSTNRLMYRPILIYKIDGEKRALVGTGKFTESIITLSTNAIHWNAMLKEWEQNPCVKKFMNKKGLAHDKFLEDEIEKIIQQNKLLFIRSVKSLRQKKNNLKIDNEQIGEIDFIIANTRTKKLFISEVKYNRARYEIVGYRNDYSNFLNDYEKKLKRKLNWAKENLPIIAEHFSIENNLPKLTFDDYTVEGIFLINTPTFYMLNGNFKTITLKNISEFLVDKYVLPEFKHTLNGKETNIKHPYFTMSS